MDRGLGGQEIDGVLVVVDGVYRQARPDAFALVPKKCAER